jgi:hypothetical protein
MQVQRRAEEFLVQLDRLAGVNPSSAAAPTGGTCAAAFATMPFSDEKRSFLLRQARDNQTENGNPDRCVSGAGSSLPFGLRPGAAGGRDLANFLREAVKQVHALRAQQHSVSSVAGSVLGNHQGKRPVGLSHIKHQQPTSSFSFPLEYSILLLADMHHCSFHKDTAI